jgi:hypothetical protein
VRLERFLRAVVHALSSQSRLFVNRTVNNSGRGGEDPEVRWRGSISAPFKLHPLSARSKSPQILV